MKRLLQVGLITLLIIGLVSPTVNATDPTIIFQGIVYIDGDAAGSGELVQVTNTRAERTFELETNAQGYFEGDVGQDAVLWDIFEVIPDVSGVDPYSSDVQITPAVISSEQIEYDIWLLLTVNMDDDILNFGTHGVNDGVWDEHSCSYDNYDLKTITESTDLTFTFYWSEHVTYATVIGPPANDYDLTADAWKSPNTYEIQSTYQFVCYQLRYASETRANDPFLTVNANNDDDDYGAWLIFADYKDSHNDPQCSYNYETDNFPNQGALWYSENEDGSKNWKIEIVLQWTSYLYCTGAPSLALWESPQGGGWNEWSLIVELDEVGP